MDYLTTKEATFLWNTTDQMIRRHCRDGRIPGAMQKDGSWCVPKNADKPLRKKVVTAPIPKLVKQLQRQRTNKIYHSLFDVQNTSRVSVNGIWTNPPCSSLTLKHRPTSKSKSTCRSCRSTSSAISPLTIRGTRH